MPRQDRLAFAQPLALPGLCNECRAGSGGDDV